MKENKDNNKVKVIYGNKNLKNIVTEMLEKIMVDKMQKGKNE